MSFREPALLVALALVQYGLSFVRRYYAGRLSLDVQHDLRRRVFDAVTRLDGERFGYAGGAPVLDGLTLPTDNPPGVRHVVYALPGASLALVACYVLGTRRDSEQRRRDAG